MEYHYLKVSLFSKDFRDLVKGQVLKVVEKTEKDTYTVEITLTDIGFNVMRECIREVQENSVIKAKKEQDLNENKQS